MTFYVLNWWNFVWAFVPSNGMTSWMPDQKHPHSFLPSFDGEMDLLSTHVAWSTEFLTSHEDDNISNTKCIILFCKLCCGVSLKNKVQTGATQFYQVFLGLYTFSNFLVNVKKKTKERILNRIESMFQPKMCYCFICFLMIIFCSSINLHPTVLQLH